MSLYKVQIKQIEIYIVGVSAKSEADAMAKAEEMMEDESAKAIFHDDSDAEVAIIN